MIAKNHLNFTVYIRIDALPEFRSVVASQPMIKIIMERLERVISGQGHGFVGVELLADDVMEAAIFLATISADPERAAMFKMFWSGE